MFCGFHFEKMYDQDMFKEIEELFVHELFDDPENYDSIYDIGLIKLKSELESDRWKYPDTTVRVRPACMPRLNNSKTVYEGDLKVSLRTSLPS